MKKHLLLIFLTAISLYTEVSAKEQFIYKRISQKDGLSATVNSIYKEVDGDVWIGSPNGLYRFNGISLFHETDSLFKGQNILRTQADEEGNFWILTNDKLICRMAGKDNFQEIMSHEDEITGPFQSICCNKTGVWFGSQGKIYCYIYDEGRIRIFSSLNNHPDFICKNMSILDEHHILCSSHHGMFIMDITTGKIEDVPFGPHKEVSSTLVDSNGNIWIGFYNNGIEVYERDGSMLKKYNSTNSNLSNDVVLCMIERDSLIWAGTDGGGINIIDMKTDRIEILSSVSGDPSSFPAHSIKSIYTDYYGNIWVGSIRDGLIRISSSHMKTYTDVYVGLNTGLSNPTVLCLHQDPNTGHIWIGTDGEGLNRFNPNTSEFTHFSSTLKQKVASIGEYSERELALSVFDDRIWIFNKKTGQIRPLVINDKNINYQMKYGGITMNLANEKDGTLLLISNSVHRLNKQTGDCIPVKNPIREKALGFYLVISQDSEGIWLHDRNNIYFIPDGSSSMMHRGTIGRTEIKCGHLGSDGNVWLATSKGLYRFCPDTDSFTHISTPLFSSAKSVICDNENRVWIGTEDQLYAYLTESGTFTLFGESDGAAVNEYLSKPHLLSSAGDVYLGGVCGLLCIDREYNIENEEDPKISLYSFSLDSHTCKTSKGKTYKVPRTCKTAEINVATHEKDLFRTKIYRYDIGGAEVIESESSRLILRSMPSPGTYKINVACTKKNGEWSTPVNILTLKVPQPWYSTWWFIISAVSFALLLAFAIAYTIENRRKNRIESAMREHEQKVYEAKVKMLINVSHELRTPLTLILAPLKRLIEENESRGVSSETLNRIYRQSRRMKELLNMVLDLRKMEEGQTSLKIESLPFNKWISETAADIINEEKEVGISIDRVQDDRIGTVEFDKQKCDTVLTNILMNAVKHSKRGDTIQVKTELCEDMVRVTVSDQGPGLGNIDQNRLFTRFYQSNNEQYGSGIGLSFSKILVEMHGGRIGATNNEERGVSFWWEIPVKAKCEIVQPKDYLNELLGNDSVTPAASSDDRSFTTNKMSLMLVDDSTELLEFLKDALNEHFAEIILATSGNMALKILHSGKKPDIIVSDINMPDGDGFSLCNSLKSDERFSHIPIVLLTARGDNESQGDSYKVGAEAFIGKPFEIDTLTEMLRGILKRKAEIRKKYLDCKSETAYTSNDESLIIRLNKIISEYLDNPELDQQIICRELGMSRVSLYNKIKAITGGGVKEYITRIRIEKAREMIESSCLSITEIAEKTGFSSSSYFSTAFKNSTGYTPSQYKQMYKKPKS